MPREGGVQERKALRRDVIERFRMIACLGSANNGDECCDEPQNAEIWWTANHSDTTMCCDDSHSMTMPPMKRGTKMITSTIKHCFGERIPKGEIWVSITVVEPGLLGCCCCIMARWSVATKKATKRRDGLRRVSPNLFISNAMCSHLMVAMGRLTFCVFAVWAVGKTV